MNWLDLIARFLNGALDAINKSNKKKMSNDAANAIANNDDGVQHVDIEISNLSRKSGSGNNE